LFLIINFLVPKKSCPPPPHLNPVSAPVPFFTNVLILTHAICLQWNPIEQRRFYKEKTKKIEKSKRYNQT